MNKMNLTKGLLKGAGYLKDVPVSFLDINFKKGAQYLVDLEEMEF